MAATMFSASFCVLLDDLGAPSAVGVLPHPPAKQRPVVDGHQRGLVRPVLDEQPRRAGTVAPRRAVQHIAVVRAEPAEHRRVVRAHCHRHRVQLQHLDPGDQPPQVRAGDGAARLRLGRSPAQPRRPGGPGRRSAYSCPGDSCGTGSAARSCWSTSPPSCPTHPSSSTGATASPSSRGRSISTSVTSHRVADRQRQRVDLLAADHPRLVIGRVPPPGWPTTVAPSAM